MAELTVQIHSHLGIGLRKKRGWKRKERLAKSLFTIQPFPGSDFVFRESQKCSYHVNFDLDLDLEHILGVDASGDRRLVTK